MLPLPPLVIGELAGLAILILAGVALYVKRYKCCHLWCFRWNTGVRCQYPRCWHMLCIRHSAETSQYWPICRHHIK
jgi:hypothetical protein